MEENNIEVKKGISADGIVQEQEKASIDTQIATAKNYPRDIAKAKNNSIAIATMDENTARTCAYALKRKSKGKSINIKGPSVHLARIIAQNWGNLRVESKVVDITYKNIKSRAVAWDLETNYAVAIGVNRKITDRYGKRYNDDMITTTGNAANAIAYRNAVLSVIPKSITDSVYNAAKNLIAGDLSDKEKLIKKRKKVIDKFNENYGVTENQLLQVLGVNNVNQIQQDEIIELIGIGQALNDGDTTIEDTFGYAGKDDKKKDDDKKDDIDDKADKIKSKLDDKQQEMEYDK